MHLELGFQRGVGRTVVALVGIIPEGRYLLTGVVVTASTMKFVNCQGIHDYLGKDVEFTQQIPELQKGRVAFLLKPYYNNYNNFYTLRQKRQTIAQNGNFTF